MFWISPELLLVISGRLSIDWAELAVNLTVNLILPQLSSHYNEYAENPVAGILKFSSFCFLCLSCTLSA